MTPERRAELRAFFGAWPAHCPWPWRKGEREWLLDRADQADALEAERTELVAWLREQHREARGLPGMECAFELTLKRMGEALGE